MIEIVRFLGLVTTPFVAVLVVASLITGVGIMLNFFADEWRKR